MFEKIKPLVPHPLWQAGRRAARRPPSFGADTRWSTISSPEWRTSPELCGRALAWISTANHLDLSPVTTGVSDSNLRGWMSLWPGEHYRLLAAISRIERPASIVEVGTATGASALCFLHGSPTSRVTTFDIVALDEYPGALLTQSEVGPNLTQIVADIGHDHAFRQYRQHFHEADVIFFDGPKDGIFEQVVIPQVIDAMKSGAVLIIDDIRLMAMTQLWHELRGDKLDLTSFGHWSGTGIVAAR